MRKSFTVALLALACLTMAAPALAQEFYKGKTITLIVGNAPGGGYDHYARLLARHMGRYVPGEPNIVVKNMPGASGLNAMNFLANSAPRDGSAAGRHLKDLPPARRRRRGRRPAGGALPGLRSP